MDKQFESVPVSYIQRQFWLASQLYPQSTAYNICNGFVFKGNFDLETFTACVKSLVKRYEIFRTNYKMINGQLMQIINKFATLDISNYIAESDTSDTFERDFSKILNEESQRPFDLETDPVIRLGIVKSSDPSLVGVSIVIHHIAIDLRTKDLLGSKLSKLYNQKNAAKGLETDEAPVQYKQYCLWQQEFQKTEQSKKMHSFWKKHLLDRTHAIGFHTDYPIPAIQSAKGDDSLFLIDTELSKKLREFAQKKKVDPFVTLLSVYFVLLYKYTRCKDFAIGVPLSNRRNDEFKDVMGCFVNTLPLTIDIDGSAGFDSLQKNVRMEMLAAHRNQETPLELIVDSLSSRQDTSRNPVYQAGFTFEPPMTIDIDGVEIKQISGKTTGAQLELFLRLWHRESHIEGQLEFNTGIFNEDTAKRMVDNFKTLLISVLEDSEQSIDQLNCVSEEDKKNLTNWNDTNRNYDLLPLNFSFEMQAQKTPNAVALSFSGMVLTYRELDTRSNQLAHYLIKHGVKQGDKVAVCMNRSIEMFVSIYGILKAGAAYVPIDPEYPQNRINYILSDIDPSTILANSDTKFQISTTDKTTICVDEASSNIDKEDTGKVGVSVQLDDIAYVIYTSGSTGKPKGVMNAHGGISNRLCWMQDAFAINDGDVVLAKTPFTFDVSVWEIFWALQVGSRIEIAPKGEHRDPAAIATLIDKMSVTTIHFVPSMLEIFLAHDWGKDLSSLKRVICSGEVLLKSLQDKFFKKLQNVELHNLYGPTEAAVDVTHWACKNNEKPFVPIGKAIANTTMYTLDGANKQTPIGVPGEICIGGIQVAKGYHNNKELTDEKFVTNTIENHDTKLYKTGDLGVFLPGGDIHFLGRLDFQIKIRGNRIELGEIEEVLRSHPHVIETVVAKVVIGQTPELVAYVTLKKQCTSEEIRKFAAKELPDYMVPSFVVFIDTLPLTSIGKIDRKALPAVDTRHLTNKAKMISPSSELEKQIATLWCNALEVKEVGIRDNFFDIGGNSLLLMSIFAKLREQFGEKLQLFLLLQYTTIEQLANYLRDNDLDEKQEKENKVEIRAAKAKKAFAKRKMTRSQK